jgi:segregation and condensation protein A
VRLFDPLEGRIGVTVTFLAILELLKESLIDVVQAEPYGPDPRARAESLGEPKETRRRSLPSA